MRTFTILFSALVLSTAAKSQTIATFDDLTLSKPDTSYINYSGTALTDVGFTDGLGYFPCYYDTASGGYWESGFSYSNWTDSVTSGYMNQYSAKTAIGYGGSAQYAVAWVSNPVTFGDSINMNLTGAAIGKPVSGFYVTNSTYAYNAMKEGYYPARAFHDSDWFLLTIKGYSGGVLTTDSVNFYLADFRFADSSLNYIVRTWEWVNLLPLGHVDSLQFSLSSTDTAGGFGMNTPSYFCMDNFTTNETDAGVNQVAKNAIAKVYPNPATNILYVDIIDNSVQQISVINMTGQVISNYNTSTNHIEINTATLPAGTYLLQLAGNGGSAQMRFVKE